MKQPKINIFGQIYDVVQIEFDKKTGLINKIVYQVNEHQNRTIFKSNEIIAKSLISKQFIHEPTVHPYHGYACAPELEKLLVL